MNILVLTNEYPNENYPKPDWTWVVPYFCREWIKQGHRVIVINNAGIFPKVYYYVASFAGKLIASIYDVSVNGLSETGWNREFSFDDKGVVVLNLPMKKWIPGGEYSDRVIIQQIKKILSLLKDKEFKPDVITGHWLNPQLRLVVELGRQYKSAKTTLVFHGDYGKKNCKKHFAERYIREIDHVGCRSKQACIKIVDYLPVKNKVFLCPSGVPDEYVSKDLIIKETNSVLRILSVGRLVKYKNLDVIIDALDVITPHVEYHMEIAGEGPLKNELQKKINYVKLSEKIYLLGKLPRETIQEKMRMADVFVLISKRETFGLVYLEAMLQGCIVIASYGGGVDGIIVDGENGFLCNEGDKNNLVQIIQSIYLMSSEQKMRISINAQLTAKEYTNSKVALNYLSEISK